MILIYEVSALLTLTENEGPGYWVSHINTGVAMEDNPDGIGVLHPRREIAISCCML